MISKFKPSVLCLIVVAATLVGNKFAVPAQSPQAKPAVLLIEPPLSGKPSFVPIIQRQYGNPGISIEDLILDNAAELRKMNPTGTSLAELRYDPAMSRYVRTRLDKMNLSHGVILDGFPATRSQAEDLAKMMPELGLSPIVLQLEIPDDTVRQRATRGGRQSDRPEIIEQRIKDYHREFGLISAYYPNARIVKIDGSRSEEDVWKAMKQVLDQSGLFSRK